MLSLYILLTYHCDIITSVQMILITHWCICICICVTCKRVGSMVFWALKCWSDRDMLLLANYYLEHLYNVTIQTTWLFTSHLVNLHWHTNLSMLRVTHCSHQKHQMQLRTQMCLCLRSWSGQEHCSDVYVFCIHVQVGPYMLPYRYIYKYLKTLVRCQNDSRLALSANISNCVYSISSLHIYRFLYNVHYSVHLPVCYITHHSTIRIDIIMA